MKPQRKPGRPRKPLHLKNPTNITPHLLAQLAEQFPPEVIVEKIHDLLEATHVTKGGQTIPDNRAREAGLKILMAYQIGLPIQRQEVVTTQFDSLDEMQQRLKNSPALKAAVAKLLASGNAEKESRPDTKA